MQARRNILIFHAGALGDFVVTWPLALALARVHPQSRVFYVTQRSKGALAERVLRLESADSEAGWHSMFAAGPALGAGPAKAALPEAQAKLLAGAHSVVSFLSSPGDAFSQSVERLSPGVNYLPVTVSPPAEFAGHVSDHLLAQLSTWPAARGALEQVLRSVASRGVGGTAPQGSAVLVHPGSGSRRKCWPAERFVSLIERLRSGGRAVRVVVGEVERETWTPAELERLAGAAELVRPGTYVELLDQLMSAGGYVGNDSGPSHLAGIIGVPTVALFGPSNAEHWRPVGPRVRVVRAPSLENIEVGQVEAALREVSAGVNA
jgi:ADP-heptose:LPS heptosyltransferase